ncbi:MAG: DUF1292 domain-containing protein [Clostridia bacterium]|nr:DUF1292 domain-containing protein [Clostridia bacterium]
MENEYNPDIITVEDENGKKHNFEILETTELDGERYVALLPVYDEASEMLESDGELVILKVVDENGEDVLVTIDDDDEFDRVATVFEEILSEFFELDIED